MPEYKVTIDQTRAISLALRKAAKDMELTAKGSSRIVMYRLLADMGKAAGRRGRRADHQSNEEVEE